MAIPVQTLQGLPPGFGQQGIDGLVQIYRDSTVKLKALAERRLVRDSRKLTANATKARQTMLEIERELQLLDQKAAEWIAANIPAHYRAGVRRANKGLKEIGFSGPIGFQPVMNREALAVLVNDMQDDLLQISENLRRNYRRVTMRTQLDRVRDKEIANQVATGIVSGQTRRQLSKDIARRLIDEIGDTITINGRKYNAQKYAELVARTKTREAVTAGTVNRQIEAGEDLVIVTQHGATDGCGFFEGRVFSISGTSGKYPGLSELPNGGPPFHPKCEHNLAPFVEELASGAERRRGAKISEDVLGKPMTEVEKIAKRRQGVLTRKRKADAQAIAADRGARNG